MTLGCSTMQPCSGSEPYTWLVVWNTNFIFPNSWDDDPIWLSYVSRWLKPPTRDQKHIPNWSKNWGEEFCHIPPMVPFQLWHYPQHLPWKKLGRCSWKRRYPSRITGRRTWKTSRVTWLFGLLRENSCWLIGALEHECYDFPIILGMSQCHHPNWPNPSFFRGIGVYHQPVLVPRCLAGEHPGIFPQRHEQFLGSWPIPPYPFGFYRDLIGRSFFLCKWWSEMERNGLKHCLWNWLGLAGIVPDTHSHSHWNIACVWALRILEPSWSWCDASDCTIYWERHTISYSCEIPWSYWPSN